MFKNKNIEFWFWFILAFVNAMVIVISDKNQDAFGCGLGFCMLLFCTLKGLICALEIDQNK